MYNKRSLSKDTKASKAPKSISKPRDIIVDPMGQWKHPGQNTRIPSSDITMKGVPYPVLGVGSNGQKQMMYPGQEYKFPGADYVDEYPQMRKGGGLKSKKYSRDLESLSATHVESPLFKKKKSKKKKIFHPKANYYQDGGIPYNYNPFVSNEPEVEETPREFNPIRTDNDPEDYQQFLNYSKTAPENRRPTEGYTYGNPNDYDHYGMWEALGKPKDFNQALEMNPDWQRDEDGYYHGFSVNPNTGVFLKSGKPGMKPGDTTWKEMSWHALSPMSESMNLTFNPDLQRFQYTPNENYIETELTPEEIQQYKDGGYIVEDLEEMEKGGSLLTKKVTCKKCGWTWDAADGGNDLTTCHKCGGEGLVHAQKGGSQVYTYADRPEAKYKKDDKGNWLISLPSTKGKYVPIKDPSGKRAGELNEKAKPVKPPQWQQDKKKYGKDKVEWYESFNPNDWFLNDYSKYSSYNSAFRNARESGEDEFIYKGKRYNTKLVDKKHSDRYWDSKKFVEEYYKNQPLSKDVLDDLKTKYLKNKYGTTWLDYYDNVFTKDPLHDDYNHWDNPKYLAMQDTLDMLSPDNLPSDDPDFLKFAQKNKYKTQLNALKKPTYFSITDYKPSDMSEDGYWDAMKNKMFMTTKADPGQLNTTFVHELSHKADDYDIYDKVPKHNIKEWQKTSWAEGWDQDKYDYISNPSEIEARKLSTLYWFKEHGWPYQPGKIREEGLDRLYDAKLNDKIPYDIDQLLDFYGTQYDDLLRYLNSDYTEKRELGGNIGDEVDLTPEQEAHLRRLGYKLERI